MAGKLSTHALDIHAGRPAAGLRVELWKLDGDGGRKLLKQAMTNADGRTEAPLLLGDEMGEGLHELVFFVFDYFHAQGVAPDCAFLDEVPVRFTIADHAASYHVPLVFSPWAYSTYRGS